MTRAEIQKQIDIIHDPYNYDWGIQLIRAICEVEHGDTEISNELWQLDKIKQVVGKFQ